MIRRYKNVKIRRKVKVRSKIKGTAKRPRLSVFRSNKAIYAQLKKSWKEGTRVKREARTKQRNI